MPAEPGQVLSSPPPADRLGLAAPAERKITLEPGGTVLDHLDFELAPAAP